jgi:hypothetical protein
MIEPTPTFEMKFHMSGAAGRKRPVKSRKKLMNTRLPCIVHWVSVIIDQ